MSQAIDQIISIPAKRRLLHEAYLSPCLLYSQLPCKLKSAQTGKPIIEFFQLAKFLALVVAGFLLASKLWSSQLAWPLHLICKGKNFKIIIKVIIDYIKFLNTAACAVLFQYSTLILVVVQFQYKENLLRFQFSFSASLKLYYNSSLQLQYNTEKTFGFNLVSVLV